MNARPENRDEDQRDDASRDDPDIASVQRGGWCRGALATRQELGKPEKPRGATERSCRGGDRDEDGANRVEQSGEAVEKTACDICRDGEPFTSSHRELTAPEQRTQPTRRLASEKKVERSSEDTHCRTPDEGRHFAARDVGPVANAPDAREEKVARST